MSAYDRLILCVDNSGSMGGPKIINSIKFLTELVDAFSCTTNYYKFGNDVHKISENSFKSLPAHCDDGTRIEFSLNQLFNRHLRDYCNHNDKTKFIFVTDAEDRISNVNGVINAKNQCISAYGNKLDCECLLTGQYANCAAELKQIFGSNSFHHCTNQQFKNVLNKLCGGIKKANNIAKTILPDLANEVEQLAKSTDNDAKKIGEDMKNILKVVAEAKQKTDQAKQKINQTKTNLNSLATQKSSVITQVDTARTESDLDRAESSTKQLKKQYRTEQSRCAEADGLLNESQKALKKEADETEKLAKQIENNGNELSKKASIVISNIITTIKELNNITTGAKEQIKELKDKFSSQLDDLMKVVSKNNKLVKEFEQCQENIDDTFKSLRRKRIELDEFQNKICQNIKQLNGVLKKIDDKWDSIA